MKTAVVLLVAVIAAFAVYQAAAECACQMIINPVCAGNPVVRYNNICEANCVAAVLNSAYTYDAASDACVAV